MLLAAPSIGGAAGMGIFIWKTIIRCEFFRANSVK